MPVVETKICNLVDATSLSEKLKGSIDESFSQGLLTDEESYSFLQSMADSINSFKESHLGDRNAGCPSCSGSGKCKTDELYMENRCACDEGWIGTGCSIDENDSRKIEETTAAIIAHIPIGSIRLITTDKWCKFLSADATRYDEGELCFGRRGTEPYQK